MSEAAEEQGGGRHSTDVQQHTLNEGLWIEWKRRFTKEKLSGRRKLDLK